MDGRPIVASAATGSLSSCLLWLLQESLRAPRDLPVPPPGFGHLEVAPTGFKWDFWCGLVIGFFLWPVLETLVLIKQWLTLTLRNRIANITFTWGKLYRIGG